MDSTISQQQQQQQKTTHHPKHRSPHGLGTSLSHTSGTSRGRVQLRRQWTTCKNRPAPFGSIVTAALPLPFMELSVSVMDTLDLLRSSIEEEIVFQATLQVPAHHAIACRIDAYDSPFANAPSLKAEPQQLSESDMQFAACLASPPDLEEASHSFDFGRPATSFVQRHAPELRAGSGLVTLTFSMRERQGQKQQDDDAADDDTALPPDAGHTLDNSNTLPPQKLLQRQGSHLLLQRTSSISSSGSSFSQQLHPWQGLTASLAATAAAAAAAGRARSWSGAAGVIPEEPAAKQENNSMQDSTAAADWAAGADDGVDIDDAMQFSRALSRLQSRSILRMERVNAAQHAGRVQLEVPLAAAAGANALACLLGFAYMVLHTWQARTEPASWLIKRHVDAFAGTGHARNSLILS